MDPVRDWIGVVTVSVFVLIGIVVWNAWAFETIASGGTLGKVATTPSQPFTPSSLPAIQSLFTERSEEEDKYVTGVYRFADPSQ